MSELQFTDPYMLAKYIKDATKQTPVKAYVQGDLSGHLFLSYAAFCFCFGRVCPVQPGKDQKPSDLSVCGFPDSLSAFCKQCAGKGDGGPVYHSILASVVSVRQHRMESAASAGSGKRLYLAEKGRSAHGRIPGGNSDRL